MARQEPLSISEVAKHDSARERTSNPPSISGQRRAPDVQRSIRFGHPRGDSLPHPALVSRALRYSRKAAIFASDHGTNAYIQALYIRLLQNTTTYMSCDIGTDGNGSGGSNTTASSMAGNSTNRRVVLSIFGNKATRSRLSQKATNSPSSGLHPFDIPIVLERVLEYVECNNEIPTEKLLERRRPSTLQHARYMYPSESQAKRVWQQTWRELNQLDRHHASPGDGLARRESPHRHHEDHDHQITAGPTYKPTPPPHTVMPAASSTSRLPNHWTSQKADSKTGRGRAGNLAAAMLVDRRFYAAAQRVLRRTVYFASHKRFRTYARSAASLDGRAKTLILHKLNQLEQSELDSLCQPQLEHLELFICGSLVPNMALLGSLHHSLRRLILPGCVQVDDAFLHDVALACPRLQVLDLRACERVSDDGLCTIASACRQLKYINVGRMNHGWRITDRSTIALAQQTQIDTIGMAGCHVGDEGIWAIGHFRGDALER